MPDTPHAQDLVVRDHPEAKRFELAVGEHMAVADYILAPTGMVFTHTLVPIEMEGQGFASKLIRGALDAARERGLSVTPICPFVLGYLKKHPEYHDLVLPSFLAQVQA